METPNTELHTRLIPILRDVANRHSIPDVQDILERYAFDVDPRHLGGDEIKSTKLLLIFEDATTLTSDRFMYALPFFLQNQEIPQHCEQEFSEKTGEDLLSRFMGTTDEYSLTYLRDIVISFILAIVGTNIVLNATIIEAGRSYARSQKGSTFLEVGEQSKAIASKPPLVEYEVGEKSNATSCKPPSVEKKRKRQTKTSGVEIGKKSDQREDVHMLQSLLLLIMRRPSLLHAPASKALRDPPLPPTSKRGEGEGEDANPLFCRCQAATLLLLSPSREKQREGEEKGSSSPPF
nr:cytochrome P450 94A2 isoform X2 [Ipomoea batatas]